MDTRLSAGWLVTIWAASVVAVALGAQSVTDSIPASPAATAGERVATLQADPGSVWPQFLGQAPPDGRVFEDFFGLTLIAGSSNVVMSTSHDACLSLIPSSQIASSSASFLGQVLYGCSAGPFPATVQIVVRGELPAELLDRFPSGSALQFVLDGTEVRVYAVE